MNTEQDLLVANACNPVEQSADFSQTSLASVSSMQLQAPRLRFFLDNFSGASMPVSTAVRVLSGACVEPIGLIHGLDLLDDD